MCVIVAKIYNGMLFVFLLWNGFWWNHHVGLAKMHDARIQRMDPKWRETIFEKANTKQSET